MAQRVRVVEGGGVVFFCPGCQGMHLAGPGWKWNGDVERPSIHPSLKIAEAPGQPGCHSTVQGGWIYFVAEGTTHGLAGQSAELPALEP